MAASTDAGRCHDMKSAAEMNVKQTVTVDANTTTGHKAVADIPNESCQTAPAPREGLSRSYSHGTHGQGVAPRSALDQVNLEIRFDQARGARGAAEAASNHNDVRA